MPVDIWETLQHERFNASDLICIQALKNHAANVGDAMVLHCHRSRLWTFSWFWAAVLVYCQDDTCSHKLKRPLADIDRWPDHLCEGSFAHKVCGKRDALLRAGRAPMMVCGC